MLEQNRNKLILTYSEVRQNYSIFIMNYDEINDAIKFKICKMILFGISKINYHIFIIIKDIVDQRA